jgi:hypothetical protein
VAPRLLRCARNDSIALAEHAEDWLDTWKGSNMPGDSQNALLETVIQPRTRDLGDGFEVRRALPSAQCRMVGAFCLL